MALGAGPMAAWTGHVPQLHTKRVSWRSSGQEASGAPARAGGGGEGGPGNAGTRLTEAFMLEGASADKKTQGAAVSPCKDGGDLRHLGLYSPGNGSHA